MKMLLSNAKSDRERMCLKYAIYKSSGLSSTAARRMYGFEHMSVRAEEVEEKLLKSSKSVKPLLSLPQLKKRLCYNPLVLHSLI